MKFKSIIILILLSFLILTGCPDVEDRSDDKEDFADKFMMTFETERIGGIESRGIKPVLMEASSGLPASRATVPASDTNPLSFSTTSGSFSDYPLPGLTTSYTVADASSIAANVYEITSATAYPSDHIIETYVEVYYLLNNTVGDDTAFEWNYNDAVVNDSGVQDNTYRVSMTINYRDGSTRHEEIVKIVYEADAEDGFAPFDVEGSLLYPDFAYPDEDSSAYFSSVVVFTHDRTRNHDYWFWEGNEIQKILGVRYYTEHKTNGGNNIQGTLVSYERTVSSFTTTGGDLVPDLDGVFIDSELDTLAESVFRQKVVFDMTGTSPQALIQDSYMRSHVVNADDAYADFILDKINEDAVVLKDWENTPYFVPSGTSAEEISAENYDQNEFLVQTLISNPDGDDIEIISSGPSDLATLFTSIETKFAATTSIPAGEDVSGGLEGDGVVAEFDANEGYIVTSTPALEMTSTTGTVEAWVYVNKHTDTAGIVHKGILTDFSDESYSLQFMGKRGNVGFAIVTQSPYRYSLAKSKLRLNTGKWYYIAGTYDAAKVRLYIFGEGVSSGANEYYLKEVNNNVGAPFTPGGNLVLGSQFTEEQRKNGYYGLDGFINGVRITNEEAKSADDLRAYYIANRGLTSNWN